MTEQEFFNNVSKSLRDYGNPYGSKHTRGWFWVNPSNTSERCAIAAFMEGMNDEEVIVNVKKELNIPEDCYATSNELVNDIVELFDFFPLVINDKDRLETALQRLADKHNLKYYSEFETSVSQSIKTSEVLESV